MEEPVTIDWSAAQVTGGKLTVKLRGDCPYGFKDAFRRTVRLLGRGAWGNVRYKKGEVRVTKVAPGTEAKLRHFLESIVAEANAAGGRAESPRKETRLDPADARMTANFRSFADDSALPSSSESLPASSRN